MTRKICFIDFETSGIDIFKDEPIQMGAILVNSNLEIQNEFFSYIQLDNTQNISESAMKTHNISIQDLSSKPSGKEVLDKFFEELGTDYRLAGWNINFDVSFFKKLCFQNNRMETFNLINYRHIDIQTICQWGVQLNLLPDSIQSLNQLVNFFGLKRGHFHNALEDAKLTYSIYLNLLKLFQENLIPHSEKIYSAL